MNTCRDFYLDSKAYVCDELISLDSIKHYANIPSCETSDDELLDEMLSTAICFFESYTRRSLIQREFTLKTSRWCQCITIMKSPLVSITSVSYYDEVGNLQVVDAANYYILENEFYSEVVFVDDFTFPTLRDRPHSIEIVFVAGYIDSTCEGFNDIKQALLSLIAYMYDSRDCACGISALTPQAKAVFNKYKIYGI